MQHSKTARPARLPGLPSFLTVTIAAMVLHSPCVAMAREAPTVRNYTDWDYTGKGSSKARVAAAVSAKTQVVKVLFDQAGVAFPPRQLFFRIFKEEMELEVWAAEKKDHKLKHVTTYGICASSGSVGPKRKQGDGQVPEGFYLIDMYNPHSRFYLSMRIGYPNKSDKILGHKRSPGNAIMIHGNCVSIGCLAMSDERIQELWVMVKPFKKHRRPVHVHLFPTRDLGTYVDVQPNVDLKAFWANLKEGFDYFETKKTLPAVTIDKKGRYHFK